MTANATTILINRLLAPLVRLGIAVDQGFAYPRSLVGGLQEVTFPHSDDLPHALSRRSYIEGYDATVRRRAYNALFDDGAILQMSYLYHGKRLKRHRLAYFGSPRTVDPDGTAFMHDQGPSTRIEPQFPTWFRFDFDDVLRAPEAGHPRSHLTIGGNERCRVPVSSPLTPDRFLSFVFHHFYRHTDLQLPQLKDGFASTISDAECRDVHVVVPQSPVSAH